MADAREAESDDGRPVEELGALSEPVPDVFATRVRNSIHRRLGASDLAHLAWFAPLLVVLEYLKVAFEWRGRTDR